MPWTYQQKSDPDWDVYGFLLLENGGKLLQENNYYIVAISELQEKTPDE